MKKYEAPNVQAKDYEYEKYVCTLETLKEKLQEFGVAVLPKVLDDEEIKNLNDGAWTSLETLIEGFSRDNPKSWIKFYDIAPLHSMLLQQHGIGHAQYVWNLRENKKILNIFSTIWNVEPEELLTSFDGVSFHPPPEVTNEGWDLGEIWLHTDQSPQRNQFECVQSWVTGYDVNELDCTLTILEKSHLYHEELRTKWGADSPSDWYKLKKETIDFLVNERGCQQKFIKCPAGSMVFWDSRTVHCGQPASKNRPKQNFRNIVYICMTPRYLADKETLKNKQNAFQNLRMSSHWPHKVTLFKESMKDNQNSLKIGKLPAPQINEIGKKLAGF